MELNNICACGCGNSCKMTYLKGHARKNKPMSQEHKDKISECAKRMWENSSVRDKILNDPKRPRHCREGALMAAILHPIKRFHDTIPEQQMKKILNELNIEYKHNYPVWSIENCYPVDFMLPNKVVIEVDGKYWHNYPNWTEKDRIRTMQLEEQGFKVLRFWENEFNINTVKNKLDEILSGNYRNCFQ